MQKKIEISESRSVRLRVGFWVNSEEGTLLEVPNGDIGFVPQNTDFVEADLILMKRE
jgi:hypothetical protein